MTAQRHYEYLHIISTEPLQSLAVQYTLRNEKQINGQHLTTATHPCCVCAFARILGLKWRHC